MKDKCSDYEEDDSYSYFNLDTILLPNPDDELCEIKDPHIVIYADANTDRVYAMNMKRDLKPSFFSYSFLIEQLKARVFLKGVLSLSENILVTDDQLTPKEIESRNRKMEIILPILGNLEKFLVSRSYGSNLVSDAYDTAKEAGINISSRTAIYALIYRYWRAGSRANAFLRKPGSGKNTQKKYKKKTGPRRNGTPFNGHMINDEDKRNIVKILNKHVFIDTPKSIPEAFDELNDAYYSDPVVDQYTGEVTGYEHWNDNRSISFEQFKYFSTKYLSINAKKVLKKQHKEVAYKKNVAGLSGNINEFFAEGPGHVYQIDETPLDIELVCEFDETRQTRIGKPTAYSVIDLFSKSIVALLLTINHSSAHTASEILFVACRNKEKFCKELGVEISHPWIQEGKPQIIFVDNAEFASELTRAFSRDAQITVMYNKEGQSQEKGAVERLHRTLQDFLFSLVPGVSKKEVSEYLRRKLRRDALINRVELYQILIEFICIRNEHYPLESIAISKDMRRDGVAPIPNRVWEWGLVNRAGYLRSADELELQIQLSETGQVTVHREHIYLPGKYIRPSGSKKTSRGIKYTSNWTLENRLQDVTKGRSRPRLECKFHRYSMNKILLKTNDGFKVATMHSDHSNLFSNMDAEDIHRESVKIAAENKDLRKKHSSAQSVTRAKTYNIVTKAKSEKISITKNAANSQNIHENRQRTIEHENNESAKRFEKVVDRIDDKDTSNTESQIGISEPIESSDNYDTSSTTQTFRRLRRNKNNGE